MVVEMRCPSSSGDQEAQPIHAVDADDAREFDQLVDWVASFERQQGRPLRVLHLGNIAGNAYLNCKFLRSAGIAADVVCSDYHHVMALPEWEDLELRNDHGDDFDPRLHPDDTAGYQRPDWYISGSLPVCVAAIQERYPSGSPDQAAERHRKLARLQRRLKSVLGPVAGDFGVLAVTQPLQFSFRASNYLLRRSSNSRYVGRLGRKFASFLLERNSLAALANRLTDVVTTAMITRFAEHFPDRGDQLRPSDILQYLSAKPYYDALFAPYDIVQCYATHPIQALIAGKRPNVAFEHGTLRHFTTGDDPLHRLTALAYREADHTFITNGDCLAYAQRLGIEHYSPIIHPVDVEQHRQDFSEDAKRIRDELGAEVLIYCPIRHDYAIKGTDLAIKALPLIKARTDKRVVMILSAWGAQVAESRALVEALGCADNVVWRTSMSRVAMIKHIQAADVVFDQFVLPVFGSTAPQTIAAGKPVLASYVPAETAWLIPEPAPIVTAFTSEEVAERTIECLDPQWLHDYRNRARAWIDQYHSPRHVIQGHLSVYRRVLAAH